MTVHVLHHGLPLCRFSTEVPGKWPKDHKWVGLDEIADATCGACRLIAATAKIPSGMLAQPKNSCPHIDTIWLYLSVDADDGNEGVLAARMGNAMVPLMAFDQTRLDFIRPIAIEIGKRTGMKLRLVKFTTREEVEEITS